MVVNHALFEETYRLVEKIADKRGVPIDSFEVAEEVDRYREYWKPKGRVKVVLIAESHVRTEADRFDHLLDRETLSSLGLEGYPTNLVRFVYCLGAGENALLAHPILPEQANASKWQFWKILWSCVNDPKKEEFPITVRRTPDFEIRLRKKIGLLRGLQGKGIWLLDASIVGINKIGAKDKDEVVRASWENYVKPLLLSLKPRPEHLVIIGMGVSRAVLGQSAKRKGTWKGIPYDVIEQPQAQLAGDGHRENLARVFRVCDGLCEHVSK